MYGTGTSTVTDSWIYGGADGKVLTASSINGTATSDSYAAYGIPSNWTGNRTLPWRNGTDLTVIGDVTFGYDGEGQRVSKTSSGVTTHYTYEGSKLIRQEENGERLFFLYDATDLVRFDRLTGSGTTT